MNNMLVYLYFFIILSLLLCVIRCAYKFMERDNLQITTKQIDHINNLITEAADRK